MLALFSGILKFYFSFIIIVEVYMCMMCVCGGEREEGGRERV